MAEEELVVAVSVEGFQQFEQSFKRMEGELDKTGEAYKGVNTESAKAGDGMGKVSAAFDDNAARANRLKLAQLELAGVQKQLAAETDVLKRAQLEVKADSLRQQIENLSKAESDGAVKTKGLGLSLTDLKSGIDIAVGAFNTFKEVAVKAFEFAQQGAQVLQLRETVKSLGIDMGALRAASGGTVDDMTLISSAAKLLAGTTGTLNEEMREAAPRLLEIARAAVKLDPSIGSVAFVYESLAKGIKKNQPLLIDNANLVVKVGAANDDMAASLGKNTSALTDEEKAVALLHATLKGGDAMIAQMGGNIESATDSYARLTTQIKNTTDTLKAETAEAIEPAVSAWANHYQALSAMEEPLFSVNNMLDSTRLFLTGTSDATERYNALLEDEKNATARAQAYGEAWAKTIEKTNASTIVLSDSTVDSKTVFDQYTAALQTSDQAMADYYASQNLANESAAAAQIAFSNAAAALSEMSEASFVAAQLDVLKASLDSGKISTQEYADAQTALLTQFGMLTPAEESAQRTLDALSAQYTSGKISAETYAAAVDKVKASMDALKDKTVTITYAMRTTGSGPDANKPGSSVAFQHGGTTSGRSMLVGERGPEMLTGVPGGARVLSAPTTARMMAQNNVTNNYNLTTNSMTRPGGLRLEFAAMEMASR